MKSKEEYFSESARNDFESAATLFISSTRTAAIINGGGAVAILTLLGKIITEKMAVENFQTPELVNSMILSLGYMSFGLVVTGISLLVMARSKHNHAKSNSKRAGHIEPSKDMEQRIDDLSKMGTILSRIATGSVLIGYVCFALGVWNSMSAFHTPCT